jgi:hypothetical protein
LLIVFVDVCLEMEQRKGSMIDRAKARRGKRLDRRQQE